MSKNKKARWGRELRLRLAKKDKAKGDKMFQVGITYGVSYLRSAMLKGNKTAASALTRKIGVNNIDQVAKKNGCHSN